MKYPRIYCPELSGQTINNNHLVLSEDSSYKLTKVLRIKPQQKIILFDGKNNQTVAEINSIEKKAVKVIVGKIQQNDIESNIKVNLGQAITKNIKMDFIIQKAVELGVNSITPIITARTVVKVKSDKQDSKVLHWQKIAIAACEQSGRNYVPKINQPIKLIDWLQEQKENTQNIILDPTSSKSIKQLEKSENYKLLIGPEGGLSQKELELAENNNFTGVKMGPRILRAETAAITALSAIQLSFGDLG